MNYYELMNQLMELETWKSIDDPSNPNLLLHKEKLFRVRENSGWGWYGRPYGNGYLCIRKVKDNYWTQFVIDSIDDQSLNAYIEVSTLEEAQTIYEKILEVTSPWVHIPTIEEWNALLWNVGLYDNSN